MLKLDQIIEVGDIKYKISTDLLKFENTNAVYADALELMNMKLAKLMK